MPATAVRPLAERYTAAFPGSKARFEQAKGIFPTGVTHDTRMMDPFPVYVDHAQGRAQVGRGRPRAHRLLRRPRVAAARPLARRRGRGRAGADGEGHAPRRRATTSKSSGASCVQKLVPSAERVRFTGSGTEATLMALRLSRLYTGRPKFLKFHGHFHGWHDYVTVGRRPALRRADRARRARRRGRELRRGPAERPEPRRGRAEGRPGHRRRDPGADRRPLGGGADPRRVPEGPARTLHAATTAC